MCKNYILLACLAVSCAIIIATPIAQRDDQEFDHKQVQILKSEVNKHEDGSYDVIYEGADGTARQEQATVVDAGTDDEALEVKGSYKYINEDGSEVEVFYTAGRNGFVPYGSIIHAEISAVAEQAKNLPDEYETRRTRKDD